MDQILGILWAFVFVSVGACIGFLLCAMMVVAKQADEVNEMILHDMEDGNEH